MMTLPAATEQTLHSWGRVTRAVSRRWQVTDQNAALAGLRAAGERGIIARGLARSYGDPCLNDGGDVLDFSDLRSIHTLDERAGTLHCDAGVSYRQLMKYLLPRGWQPPVCPGTAFVTMGGAVANDIHGKNHHAQGSFGDHIDWLDMLLPDGTVRRVSRESDPDLFAATVGGIGLTGLILSLQFRLARVPSNAVELREVPVQDLDAFLEMLASTEVDYPHVVGWIDALTRGRHLGRGILELARPSLVGVREPRGLSMRAPFDFPGWVLSRPTVSAFNSLYFHRVPRRGRERRVHINKFLYPLDAIHNWNRMYGRRGVFQFQCCIPFSSGRAGIVELMEETTRSRGASFLAVLKSMGRRGAGMLSFPMPGFTLAIDFPRHPETRQLVERLQDIALKHGGRVYLAKDACLKPDMFRAMYPEVDRFKTVLRSIDPKGIMQSDMSRRLQLTPG